METIGSSPTAEQRRNYGRVGRRSCTTGPSRPGDLHPEPLTDSGRKPLDLSGSCHPLKAAAFHRDRRVPPVSPLTLFDRDAGDLLPLLLGHYPVSTLLRSSPPLVGASVLSASWCIHLCLFPCHRPPGSQVPYESQDWIHASSAPDTARPVSRFPPCCSRNRE